MKVLSREIYKKILEGFPLHEIQTFYQLPSSEFSKYLKDIRDNGYRFQRTIFSDGRIFLKPDQTLKFNPKLNQAHIVVPDNRFLTMFISDTHIGNISERLDYIKLAYQYAKEHDIHIIMCAGDMIDNVYPDRLPRVKNKSVDIQVQKVTRHIPDIPGTITLCLYGNHEAHSLFTEGRDISHLIEDRRYDLISLGYGGCRITLKSDHIGISHYIKKIPIKEYIEDVSINFRGNSHKSKTSFKEDKEVYIPALSNNDASSYEYAPLPGFIVAEILFVNRLIERVNTTQLAIVNGKLRLSNEDAIVLRKVPPAQRKEYYKN